jgi:ATP-binding cassette subfamily E protein 1
VRLVNVPSAVGRAVSHSFGHNAFRLCGLPMPSTGKVLGILGVNGSGKSTALSILSGKLMPNLGVLPPDLGQHPEGAGAGAGAGARPRPGAAPTTTASTPTWADIIRAHRGSELQNYFVKLSQGSLRVSHKPQIDHVFAKLVKRKVTHAGPVAGPDTVRSLLSDADERGAAAELAEALSLSHLMDRPVEDLSGGELQRLAIARAAGRDADVYIFDEVSSFLDTKERLAATRVIRSLAGPDKYVIIVEHDLAILDAAADSCCCLFGEPGAFGVFTHPSVVANAINQWLAGFFPAENMRFRLETLSFRASAAPEAMMGSGPDGQSGGGHVVLEYPEKSVTLRGSERVGGNESGGGSDGPEASCEFTLHVTPGCLRAGTVTGLLGCNGCGKSTLLDLLSDTAGGKPTVSFKHQHNARALLAGGKAGDNQGGGGGCTV